MNGRKVKENYTRNILNTKNFLNPRTPRHPQEKRVTHDDCNNGREAQRREFFQEGRLTLGLHSAAHTHTHTHTTHTHTHTHNALVSQCTGNSPRRSSRLLHICPARRGGRAGVRRGGVGRGRPAARRGGGRGHGVGQRLEAPASLGPLLGSLAPRRAVAGRRHHLQKGVYPRAGRLRRLWRRRRRWHSRGASSAGVMPHATRRCAPRRARRCAPVPPPPPRRHRDRRCARRSILAAHALTTAAAVAIAQQTRRRRRHARGRGAAAAAAIAAAAVKV